MGRKHQLQRRAHNSPLVCVSPYSSSSSSTVNHLNRLVGSTSAPKTISGTAMNHMSHMNASTQMSISHTTTTAHTTSASSATTTTLSAMASSSLSAAAASQTATTSSLYSSPSTSSAHRQRRNLIAGRRNIPSRVLQDSDICAQVSHSGRDVLAFAKSVVHSVTLAQDDMCLMSLPLPPVIQRMDMAGSPFSTFAPLAWADDLEERGDMHPSANNWGARTHSSGGGGSGGGGDSPTGSGDMSPGGGDGGDGEQPSEYTFRRRNAIVEGSDEAPKADDFTDGSPN
ncbi:hypothetical protein BGZ94_001199 [Podila epigama]|nr:hypothetical protein BGZ94_001199 [Podila epigama]